MGKVTKTNSAILRQKAEELLKYDSSKKNQQISEAETIKLYHELYVNQVELKLQNEELIIAISAAQDAIKLYDLAPTGYFTISGKSEILNSNLFGANMLGKERRHLITNRFDSFISDQTRPIFTLFLHQTIQSKTKETCEVTLTGCDNSPMHVQLTGMAIENEDCLITVNDITKRKKAEDALLLSESRYRLQTENISDIIWVLDPETMYFLYVSPSVKQILGYTPSEFMEMTLTEVLVPAIREPFVQLTRQRVQQFLTNQHPGIGYRNEAMLLRKDGSSVVLEISNHYYLNKTSGRLEIEGISRDISGKKQSVEALRKSEERFSLSMDATSDGLWDWDIQSGEVYYSPGYFRMLGYEPNELEKNILTWKNLLHPDDLNSVVENNEACINNVIQSINSEIRLKAKDGTWRWIHSRGKAVERDSNGKALRMIGTHVDITERKEAVEEMLRKDTLLNLTGKMAKIGGWESDIGTLKQKWTEEVYRIHEVDFSFDPNISNGINFYAPLSRPVIENAMNRAVELGEPFDLELEFITSKGNHKWVHSIGIAHQENGKTRKIYGTIQDITARKNIEQALKESESLYRAIVNASPDQITIADLDGRINMVSPATIKLFGYEWSEELRGRLVTDFLAPEDRELAASHIALRMQGIKNGPNEYRAQRADGNIFFLEVNGEFIQPEEGPPTQMLYIGRDISDRKKAELEIKLKNEELVKLNAEKDRFFSVIAHDLRSPFNGFLGYTQILAEQLSSLNAQQIQNIATGMYKSATNLFGLLENLLQWARIQQGLIPFNPELFQLHQIAGQNIDMLMQAANNKEIQIYNCIRHHIMVFTDHNMLHTILRNLLSNAVKFTPRKGEISLSAKICTDGSIEISVTDSGIGMSPAMVGNLFRIDEQSNRKGTEGEPSTGLGLILCKDFIEKYGGKIWVKSDIEDLPAGKAGGSTFYFTIPGHHLS